MTGALGACGAGSSDPLTTDKSGATLPTFEQFTDFCEGDFGETFAGGFDDWEVATPTGRIDGLLSDDSYMVCETSMRRLDVAYSVRIRMTHALGSPPTEGELEEDARSLPNLSELDAYIGSDGLLWLEFHDTSKADPGYSDGTTEVKHYLSDDDAFIRVSVRTPGDPELIDPDILHRAVAAVTAALVDLT